MNHRLIELDAHLDTIFELKEESAKEIQAKASERREKRAARQEEWNEKKADYEEYRKNRRRSGKEIGTMAAGIGVGGAALGAAGATIYGVRKAGQAIGGVGRGVGAVAKGVGSAGKAVVASAKKAPKAWRKRAATHRRGIAKKAAGGGKIAKARQWLNKKGGRLGKIHILEQNIDEIIELSKTAKKPRTWRRTARRGAATLAVGAGLGALAGNAINRNRRKREDWEREDLVKILRDKKEVERLADE